MLLWMLSFSVVVSALHCFCRCCWVCVFFVLFAGGSWILILLFVAIVEVPMVVFAVPVILLTPIELIVSLAVVAACVPVICVLSVVVVFAGTAVGWCCRCCFFYWWLLDFCHCCCRCRWLAADECCLPPMLLSSPSLSNWKLLFVRLFGC